MESTQLEMFEYLDHLQNSGITNMYGAAPYLMLEYPHLEKIEARKILSDWMATYAQRHPQEVS